PVRPPTAGRARVRTSDLSPSVRTVLEPAPRIRGTMGAVDEHKAHAPKSVKVAVITISDTRTEATDESGKILKQLLLDAGHKILFLAIVKDEAKAIADAVEQASWTCDAIVTNGWTVLSKRDVTIKTLQPGLVKVLPGFGELFRVLSYPDIGSAAMLSREIPGV